MPVPKRFGDIFVLLVEGTEGKKLVWDRLPTTHGWLTTSGSYMYTLNFNAAPDEPPHWIELRLLDADGNEIDSVAANEEQAGFESLRDLVRLVSSQVEAMQTNRLDRVRAELRATVKK